MEVFGIKLRFWILVIIPIWSLTFRFAHGHYHLDYDKAKPSVKKTVKVNDTIKVNDTMLQMYQTYNYPQQYGKVKKGRIYTKSGISFGKDSFHCISKYRTCGMNRFYLKNFNKMAYFALNDSVEVIFPDTIIRYKIADTGFKSKSLWNRLDIHIGIHEFIGNHTVWVRKIK